MLDIAQGFIAYQDEEHGLGHKAAQSLAYHSITGLQPTRRADANAVLAAITGNQAEKALIPLERDGSGYDTAALAGLIDYNKSLHVTGDLIEEDQYCLAVPSALIHEIAQSAHPGSFGEHGAINLAKVNRRADAASFKFSLKKRLEIVYVTPDALTRCAPAIEAMRADGIEIKKIDSGIDPYRSILKLARDMLDPDRIIKTRMKGNEHIRTSKIRGSNHVKQLVGVLLPLEIAYGGTRNIKEITSDGRKVLQNPGQYFDGDYFPLIDNLGAGRNLKSRFLTVERRPSGPPAKHKSPLILAIEKFLTLFAFLKQHNLIKRIDGILDPATDSDKTPFPYSRILLKLDTRLPASKGRDPSDKSGPYVGDLDTVTQALKTAGIPYVPVYLHTDKSKLPVTLEVEIDKTGLYGCTAKSFWVSLWHRRSIFGVSCRHGYRCGLNKALQLSAKKSRNHDFMVLGAYGATTPLLEKPAPTTTPASVGLAKGLAVLSILIFVGILAIRLLG